LKGEATRPWAEAIVDDPAAPLRLHDRHGRLSGVEGRGQDDGDQRVPLLRREVLDGRDVLDARIVDQDVEAAEFAHRIVHQVGDLIGPGHVGAVIADR
jgi:hypothetical protein